MLIIMCLYLFLQINKRWISDCLMMFGRSWYYNGIFDFKSKILLRYFPDLKKINISIFKSMIYDNNLISAALL